MITVKRSVHDTSFAQVVLIRHAKNQVVVQRSLAVKTPLVCNIFSRWHGCVSAGDTAPGSRNQLLLLASYAVL